MKNFIITVFLTVLCLRISAQAVWVEPKNPNVNRKLRIYCDISKATAATADKMKADPVGPYYIWTWLPTESTRADSLANGTGDKAWKNSNDKLKMTKDESKGPNVWYYEMIPVIFYNTEPSVVYEKGISFLVKPKDGGGYGEPDVKTEDFSVKIEPPVTDRGLIYAFPSTIYENEISSIIYDNPAETKTTMKNLGNEEIYIWYNLTVRDTATNITRTVASSPFFELSNDESLRLKKDSNGKYRITFIPRELFNITSPKETIVNVEIIVRKKNYQGPDDRCDAQPKIILGCK